MDYKAIYMGMTGTVKTLLGGGPFKLLGTGLIGSPFSSARRFVLCLHVLGVLGLLYEMDEHQPCPSRPKRRKGECPCHD